MATKCKVRDCFSDSVCKGYCKCHFPGERKLRGYSERNKLPSGRLLSLEIEAIARDVKGHEVGTNLGLCCSDGSLQSEYGGEFKLVANSASGLTVKATALVRKLASLGWIVNRHCGLHIGVDVRELGSDRLREVKRYLELSEDFWFSLVPTTRRQNGYIYRLSSNNGGSPNYFTNHYGWANVALYGRLEIRIHPGTLNPHKLSGWIDVWRQMQERFHDASFPLVRTEVDENEEAVTEVAVGITELIQQPSKAAKYLNARHLRGGVLLSENDLQPVSGEQT